MPLFCHALGCYQEGITAVEHKVLSLLPFLSSLSLSLSLLCTQALFIECNVTHATVRSLPALNTAHTTLTLSSSIQRPCPCSIIQSMWCSTWSSSQHLLLYRMLYQLFSQTICNILNVLLSLPVHPDVLSILKDALSDDVSATVSYLDILSTLFDALSNLLFY